MCRSLMNQEGLSVYHSSKMIIISCETERLKTKLVKIVFPVYVRSYATFTY